MIADAAAIANTLAERGRLPAELVHRWYGEPRNELAGMTPTRFLEVFGNRGSQRVLQLARDDVDEGWPHAPATTIAATAAQEGASP